MMKTVTVELRDKNALRLLKDLELANIIRVLDNKEGGKKENRRLSASIRGAISQDRARELNQQLDLMRKEWGNRDI